MASLVRKQVFYGALLGAIAMAVGISYEEMVVRPTQLGNTNSAALSTLPPFVEGDWIKIPFDRSRSKECLTQSTFTLNRVTQYPPPLGRREDDIVLEIRNSPLSGLGLDRKLIWLKRPAVPAGDWSVQVDAGKSCSTWLSNTTDSGPIPLGMVHLDPEASAP